MALEVAVLGCEFQGAGEYFVVAQLNGSRKLRTEISRPARKPVFRENSFYFRLHELPAGAFAYRLELGAFAVQPDEAPPGPDAPPSTILLGSLQLQLNYCVEQLLEGKTVREPKLAFLRSVSGRERRMGQVEVAMRLITAPSAASSSVFHVYVHDVSGAGAAQSLAVEASTLPVDAQRAMDAAEKEATTAGRSRLELHPPTRDSGGGGGALWHALSVPSRSREVDTSDGGARWDELLSVAAAGDDDALRLDVCDAGGQEGTVWASLGGATLPVPDLAPARPLHVRIPLRGGGDGAWLRATVVRTPSLRQEMESAAAEEGSGARPWRAEVAVGGIASALFPPPHRMGVRVSLCSEAKALEAVRAFPAGSSAPEQDFQRLGTGKPLNSGSGGDDPCAYVPAVPCAPDGAAATAAASAEGPSWMHPCLFQPSALDAQEGAEAWVGAVLLRFHDEGMRPLGMACVPTAFLTEGASPAAATAAREAATALGRRVASALPSGAAGPGEAGSPPQPQPPVVPPSGSAVQVAEWPVQWVSGVRAAVGGSLWLVLRAWTAGAFTRQAHAAGLTADGRLVPASQLPGGGGAGGEPRSGVATLAASTEVFTGDPPAQGGAPQIRVAPAGGGGGGGGGGGDVALQEHGRVVRFPSWLRLATACRLAAYGRLGGGGVLELVVNPPPMLWMERTAPASRATTSSDLTRTPPSRLSARQRQGGEGDSLTGPLPAEEGAGGTLRPLAERLRQALLQERASVARLTEEVDRRGRAIQQCGTEIVRLRARAREAADEADEARQRLHAREERDRAYLEEAARVGAGAPADTQELHKQLFALRVGYAEEKERAEHLLDKARALYKKAKRGRKASQQLRKVEKASVAQAGFLQKLQRRVAQVPALESTIRTQEKVIGRLERLIEGKLQERLREVAEKSRRLDAQLASAESQQGRASAMEMEMERLRERLEEAEAAAAAGGGGAGAGEGGGGDAGVQLMVAQFRMEVLEQEKERAAREAADRVSSMEMKVMALESELERLGVDPNELYDDVSTAGGTEDGEEEEEEEEEEGTGTGLGDATPRSLDRESSLGEGGESVGEGSGALDDLDLDDGTRESVGSGGEGP